MTKTYSALVFVLVLSLVSIFYNYHGIFFKRPQSVHKWRQSDCASIALNYYQNNTGFFTPETHNLTSDNGSSGKCCTSEIPVLYYSVASLYKVFGHHDYIYRIFNTFLFFLGLFYLFRLILLLIQDTFWAISISILFFTSPVLVYYGNNFLTNSSALAFSIIGWYYFFRFTIQKELKWFIVSMIIFLFATAFKLTALFSVFAIAGIFILELSGLLRLKSEEKLFYKPIRFLVPLSIIFLIIGGWLIYASTYNQKHDCYYFSTTIFPIWDLNNSEISKVLDNIRKIWLDQYFHKTVLLLILVCTIFIISFLRKNKKILNISILIIFVEIIVYVLLQFWTFRDHDYYIIDMYILPLLIFISTIDILKRLFPIFLSSLYLKTGFILFLLFNIFYAREQLNARYDSSNNQKGLNNDLFALEPYLRQIGVLQTDTVISIPDYSHVSLYLMNQKGWTEYSDARFNKGKRIFYNQDSTGIQLSIDKGAKYLIVNGIKQLYYKPYLQSFCKNLVGQYNKVLIFNLKSKTVNYSLEERTIDAEYFCDAESLSHDKKWYTGVPDSFMFQAAANQNNEFAFRGKFSCKVDASSRYGMTIKLKNLKKGESFAISSWIKQGKTVRGVIIASSSPNQYYNNDFTVIEKDSTGWEKIYKEFFVPEELENQELVIYGFNPAVEAVYFDDLKIIRYKSVIEE